MIDELKWMLSELQRIYPDKKFLIEKIAQRKWAILEQAGIYKLRAFNLQYASNQHELAELIENYILKERSEKEV